MIDDGYIKKAFLVILCGLPFAHFVFNRMDMWHAHGHFFQVGILALFCLSLVTIGNKNNIKNLPLALFTLWAGVSTSSIWYNLVSASGQYPAKLFFSFFNFLCFLLFYKLSIEYLNKEYIEKILRYLSYSVFLVLLYCVVQKLNLDQFYKSIDPKVSSDDIVGTIGNTSHLAGYLALCLPLFLNNSWFSHIGFVLLCVVLFMSNSASGVITAGMVLLFYLWHKNRLWFAVMGFVLFSLLTTVAIKCPLFFNPSHRVEFWKALYPKFQAHAITGSGLGVLNIWQIKLDTSIWRHAHQAYYQIGVELGLIGVAFLLWCIVDYFRRFKELNSNVSIRLKSMFFGFCVLGMFTFPDRLWLLASMGMLSYSFMFALDNEVLNGKNPR